MVDCRIATNAARMHTTGISPLVVAGLAAGGALVGGGVIATVRAGLSAGGALVVGVVSIVGALFKIAHEAFAGACGFVKFVTRYFEFTVTARMLTV